MSSANAAYAGGICVDILSVSQSDLHGCSTILTVPNDAGDSVAKDDDFERSAIRQRDKRTGYA